ncbi:hypothetical protein ACRRTK_007874 [Alexandromys fortis]
MDLQRPDSYQGGAGPHFSEHVLHKCQCQGLGDPGIGNQDREKEELVLCPCPGSDTPSGPLLTGAPSSITTPSPEAHWHKDNYVPQISQTPTLQPGGVIVTFLLSHRRLYLPVSDDETPLCLDTSPLVTIQTVRHLYERTPTRWQLPPSASVTYKSNGRTLTPAIKESRCFHQYRRQEAAPSALE